MGWIWINVIEGLSVAPQPSGRVASKFVLIAKCFIMRKFVDICRAVRRESLGRGYCKRIKRQLVKYDLIVYEVEKNLFYKVK